ncbi:hypothetical protein DM860_018249 [Cuscuta australis]|uniref:Uncharacterized protein n=1 Tax=Cuscuta australis TaxID=267555 RepID=A0A328DAB5_9ASTE|nr:hypothetical protein DM860_018249 [Cuscuta australis]
MRIICRVGNRSELGSDGGGSNGGDDDGRGRRWAMLVMVRVERLWWRGMVEMVGEWIGGGADDNGWAGGEVGRGYGGGCGFSMVAGLGKEGEGNLGISCLIQASTKNEEKSKLLANEMYHKDMDELSRKLELPHIHEITKWHFSKVHHILYTQFAPNYGDYIF